MIRGTSITNPVMAIENSTQTESSPVNGLSELLSVEPKHYELAWHELKAQILPLAAPLSTSLVRNTQIGVLEYESWLTKSKS